MINSTVNIPLTKVYVHNSYLGIDDGGYTEGYWYGLTSIPARQFITHVMLFNGSNWSGLPLAALSTTAQVWDTIESAQAYDCFSYEISCIRFDFLRDQKLKVKHREAGTYLFTILSHDSNGRAPFAEFPEQAKTFTFIELDNGTITCAPNNFICWTDSSLYEPDDNGKKYKRLSQVFRTGK